MKHQSKSNICTEEDVKEEFCPVCATVPLAMATTGSTLGSGLFPKYGHIITKVSIIVTVILVLLTFYYLRSCNTCKL